MQTEREAFWVGARAGTPLLVGAVPFGMIYGTLCREAGCSIAITQAVSSIGIAGSVQFITAQEIPEAVPGLITFLTIATIKSSVAYTSMKNGMFKQEGTANLT